MAKFIHQPHDKLFRRSMSELFVAKDFFETHVPKNILEKIDLSNIFGMV